MPSSVRKCPRRPQRRRQRRPGPGGQAGRHEKRGSSASRRRNQSWFASPAEKSPRFVLRRLSLPITAEPCSPGFRGDPPRHAHRACQVASSPGVSWTAPSATRTRSLASVPKKVALGELSTPSRTRDGVLVDRTGSRRASGQDRPRPRRCGRLRPAGRDARAHDSEADISRSEANPLGLSGSLIDSPLGVRGRVALGVVFADPPRSRTTAQLTLAWQRPSPSSYV